MRTRNASILTLPRTSVSVTPDRESETFSDVRLSDGCSEASHRESLSLPAHLRWPLLTGYDHRGWESTVNPYPRPNPGTESAHDVPAETTGDVEIWRRLDDTASPNPSFTSAKWPRTPGTRVRDSEEDAFATRSDSIRFVTGPRSDPHYPSSRPGTLPDRRRDRRADGTMIWPPRDECERWSMSSRGDSSRSDPSAR